MSSFCLPVTELIPPSLLRMESRPRLFTAIDESCASPILWVGGPPGAGKSAAVAGYLSARGLASTWCRVNSEVRTDAPRSSLVLGDLLQRESPPIVLVIEDCHRVAPTALAEMAAQVALDPCSRTRLILIGRGEPPATVAPLIVKGLIARLAPSDLRFSVEEVQQWAGRLKLDATALAPWFGKCHGWALGISRALDALRRSPTEPTQACETAKQEAFAYFAAEVFECASRGEQQLLVSAALVSRPTSQMAEALSGRADAHEVLVRIAARDGLLIRSAGVPPVYQFLPLFRDFLLDRIAATFVAAELQALAMRASALLEKDPQQDWLGDGDLLQAYRALREGDHARCHHLLCTAIADAHHVPEAAQILRRVPPRRGDVVRGGPEEKYRARMHPTADRASSTSRTGRCGQVPALRHKVYVLRRLPFAQSGRTGALLAARPAQAPGTAAGTHRLRCHRSSGARIDRCTVAGLGR